jgi:outer membrane protein assembly factor BamD (BamD/ComL family)
VQQLPDLFAENTSKSNDFYFYNSSSKARGFSEFKARWGERPNVDNWRRKSAIDRQTQKAGDVDDVPAATSGTATQTAADNSYEGLQANIPLTQEKVDSSNENIMEALFTLGQTFAGKLEEYPAAIQAYEELLRRFPNTLHKEEAMFNLVYAYQKSGDKAKADQYKNELLNTGGNSKWAALIKNGSAGKSDQKATAATKKYEEIYNLFIEGNFAQAKNEKKMADSVYGNSYWTPQLLFIESIYYIKQQEDSAAIKVLTNLSTIHAGNPMAERAKTMIDVLRRRRDIEDYLTKLDVTRKEERRDMPAQRPVASTRQPVIPKPATLDTVKTSIDSTSKKMPANVPVATPAKKDTLVAQPVVIAKNFSFVATDSQYVVILLDKVDPVYSSEAKNAFNRYNREKFYNQKIDISGVQLDERWNLVLQGPFLDAAVATDYIDKVKPVAKSRILPWLTSDKYTFLIISGANLNVLKSGKDMEGYRQLLQKALPGKF